jgi:hypothetical protein
MHLVGYLYEYYHDARSLEHRVIRTAWKQKNFSHRKQLTTDTANCSMLPQDSFLSQHQEHILTQQSGTLPPISTGNTAVHFSL